MFKIKTKQNLSYHVWDKIHDYLLENRGVKIDHYSKYQIIIRPEGSVNSIQINFYDDEIKVYKTIGSNTFDHHVLYNKVIELIEASVKEY